ncbi:T6SS effector phospholipase Tle3 domain-containing protein [Telluria beijingensis]|uniref:T6SS effector phospholipase Tle3 domain-containing protein n=1 Tax=Telluria beijingensis TaxID=3068633 RepID=UPI002795A687|nr:hypothetical protein [Massilia sp. REN29]
MSTAAASDSPCAAHSTGSPLDDPANLILGSNTGIVFLSPKHLDVVMQLPLPGIVIFVHGVNSDGEWYQQTEEGLCNGLNDRLKRGADHLAFPTPEGGQLRPVEYMPELTPKGFINPERNAKSFITSTAHFSPVIQFRWGYKASSDELQQFSDGIFLNEQNYWGGGPFANGCTALPDLWSAGLSNELFLWLHVEHMNPANDRKVYACPPRPYYVLAALRLARLVESIREKQADVPITIVCHSQGNMIGMAAAFLGDRLDAVTDANGKTGRCVADNYVLCNPPYSLVKSNTTQGWVERGMKDAEGKGGRQTWEARIATLRAFFDIVRRQRAAEQPCKLIDEAMRNDLHGFDAMSDRYRYGMGDTPSTHGRVTLYFNPHDQVISACTIQGIGWRGMSQQEIDAANGHGVFCQRVFSQGFEVGKKGTYDFWADQHNKPAPGSHGFWYPLSPVAKYSIARGLDSHPNVVGKIMTFAMAPVMIAITGVAGTRINALPPNDWRTPLTAPDLPNSFKPQAMRFGVASEQFDQGMDAPGEYRDKKAERAADDPYAGDRPVPQSATEEAKRKGSDAAEGDQHSEAGLLYEHRALLRMEAKREGIYATKDQVTAEDKPETASEKYTEWRTKKIKATLAKTIDTHATDHSTIMTNGMHAQRALAYDVAVGICRISAHDPSFFRSLGDWRILGSAPKENSHNYFHEYFQKGKLNDQSIYEWSKTKIEGGMPVTIADKREIFG